MGWRSKDEDMSEGGFRSKRKDTTPIPWRMAQDKGLSIEATAIITYLMTKPDHWRGRNFDIEERFGIGEKLRRRAVKEAEQAGWLALRRVRHPVSGQIDSFYEVQDGRPLNEADRTRSEDLPSIPIWTWQKFLIEYELPPDTPPPPAGGDGHPPLRQGVAAQGVASQGVAEGGDIDNKELDLLESKKEKEGEPSPLLPFLIKKFVTDPLTGRKDVLKEPAIRVTVAFHQAKSPNTKPTDSRFFLADLDAFANALGYHGLQHEPRILNEITEGHRDRNELPFDLLKRLGLGPPPKGPHPSWDQKFNVMVERCTKALKERLAGLADRPQELSTADGQKYRRTATDCVWLALGSLPYPNEVKKDVGKHVVEDVASCTTIRCQWQRSSPRKRCSTRRRR
jgi:hypothetical protein